MDLQLRRVPTFRVRGQVVDPNPSPGSRGISVMALEDGSVLGPMNSNFARVRGDGTFELSGLPVGSYTLVAARMDSGRQRAAVPVQIANRDIDNVVLQLQPPVEAPVAIRMEGEQMADMGLVRMTVEPERPSPIDHPLTAERKPDGKMSVWLLPAGRVRINVGNLPDGTYLKSVRAGSLDVTNSYFEASGAGPIEVVLARGAGQITGTVQTPENKPYPNAFILLAPDSSKGAQYWNYRTAIADGSGAFALKGLAPGEYIVFAFNDSQESSWQNPEFLKQYESNGIKIKVGENGNETVQSTVILVP